ncbi:MAG: hypothetical protein FWJ66_04355 [Caldibacillus sp.]
MLRKIWEKYSYVILLFVITFLSFYLIVDHMVQENIEQERQSQQWEIVVNNYDEDIMDMK